MKSHHHHGPTQKKGRKNYEPGVSYSDPSDYDTTESEPSSGSDLDFEVFSKQADDTSLYQPLESTTYPDDSQALVIDHGSSFIRAGMSGDDAPRSVFPAVVGILPNNPSVLHSIGGKDRYIGNEAISKRGILTLKYPIESGIITNFDLMSTLWHHTFYNELSVAPEEHPVLLTEASLGPRYNREKMTQIMFEEFNVPSLYVALRPVLTLYSTGRATGVVIQSGSSSSTILPIFEGYALPHAYTPWNVTGNSLSKYLEQLILSEYPNIPQEQKELIHDNIDHIKSSLCYVSKNLNDDTVQCTYKPENYELDYQFGNNTSITLSNIRFQCPESIFSPPNMNINDSGLHEVVFNSVTKCDTEIQPILFKNIILAGGNASIPNLEYRLSKEVSSLIHGGSSKIKVIVSPDGVNSSWVGGSILSSLSTFQDMWISKAQYDDQGPSVVHRMCF